MNARIAALRKQHAVLEERLARQLTRPRPDDVQLIRLKVKKLRLKDELESLNRRQGRSGLRRTSSAQGH